MTHTNANPKSMYHGMHIEFLAGGGRCRRNQLPRTDGSLLFFFVASLEFISMPAPARRAATEQSIISCKRPGSATDGLAAMAHSQNHEGMTTTTTLYTVLILKALTRS